MTTLLVDGDVVVHLAADKRVNGVTPLDIIKSRFKDQLCQQMGVEVPVLRLITLDDIELDEEQTAAFTEECWKRYNDMIDELEFNSGAKETRIAMKGETNFRDEIFPQYKAHRKVAKKKNEFVPLIRDRAVREKKATYAINMEADDLLSIWAAELKTDYIIASVDKDLLQIPGKHYRIHKRELVDMSVEDALKFYYTQLITGDMTDGIYGIKGIGPIKADRLLSQVNTESEYQAIVKLAYQRCYGKNWAKELTLNGRLIYLLKHTNDIFDHSLWPDVHIDVDTPDSIFVRSIVKENEELTIEMALANINPAGNVSNKVWNDSLTFVMKATADLSMLEEEEALTALEIIATRGKIPEAEADAFKVLVKSFAEIANVKAVATDVKTEEAKTTEEVKEKLPLSFEKVVPESMPKSMFGLSKVDVPKPTEAPKVETPEVKPMIPVGEKPKFVFKMPGS